MGIDTSMRPRVTNGGELSQLYLTDPEYARHIGAVAEVFGNVPFAICQRAVDLIYALDPNIKEPDVREKANLDEVLVEVRSLLRTGDVAGAQAFIGQFEDTELE